MTTQRWFVKVFIIAAFFALRLEALAQIPQLTISEVFADPKAVGDSDGEWFELYNPGDQDFNLNGVLLRDEGRDSHSIENDVILKPKEYAVFCKNGDSSQNGGVNCAYTYSKFNLANESDEIILEKEGEIARLVYSKSTHPIKSGASMEYGSGTWHFATAQFGNGDYGTPGSENSQASEPTSISTSTPVPTQKPTRTPTPSKEPTKIPTKDQTPTEKQKQMHVLGDEVSLSNSDEPTRVLLNEAQAVTKSMSETQFETNSPTPTEKKTDGVSKFVMWGGVLSMMVSIGSFLIITNRSG
jgi:hypothetical protein